MSPDVLRSYQLQRLCGCYIINGLLFQCFSVNNHHGNTHVCHRPFQCRTVLVKLIIGVQRWSDPIRSLPHQYQSLFSLHREHKTIFGWSRNASEIPFREQYYLDELQSWIVIFLAVYTLVLWYVWHWEALWHLSFKKEEKQNKTIIT